ncbi:MAG TPA: biotin synthase BioB, partial [Sphingomonadaceae bacterium]|nr:biotin synthase BioB [Sphingomonadaceae bacterium]
MTAIRTDWTRAEIAALFDLPFTELVFHAAEIHRAHHRPDEVQLCTLLSIKTGGCPEDCGYCAQSVKADCGIDVTKLMDVREVLQSAARAKDAGSQRFCMGAAWRNPKDRDMPAIVEIVEGVRDMGLETCMTLGMLTPKQAEQLAEAGLDYYNHNIDSSPEYYARVITTRRFEDRLETLENVRAAGIAVC